MVKVPDGTLRILVQGTRSGCASSSRCRTTRTSSARFEELPDLVEDTPEIEALTREVQALFGRIVGARRYLPEELQLAAANVDDPSALCHLVASTLRLKTEERQQLLEMIASASACAPCSLILNRELEVSELGSRSRPRSQPRSTRASASTSCASSSRRSARSSARATSSRPSSSELRGAGRGAAAARGGPQGRRPRARAARAAAARRRRVRRHPHVPRLDPVAPVGRATTDDNLDLDARAQVLDEDHFDLEKVKERIVEYLAVTKLKDDLSGPDPLLRRPARAWARRRSASRSRGRSGGRSPGSRWAASATSPRSAATGARTSARCPARSSARIRDAGRGTRSS